mgnify:CR=1 FL=1
MISSAETAYAAGIFDGEGSVSLTRNHSNRWPGPQVSVASTDPELMDWLKAHFGGVVTRKRTYAQHHRPSFQWKLTDRKALDFLRLVRPFLVIKRKLERCDLLLDEYAASTPRNGRYTPEMAERKQRIIERFASIP